MQWDVVIMGGGLAGLANAIGLARDGWKVALVEKKSYPFHRVCGEYVSLETLPFLKRLGFDPFEAGAVRIDRLRLTAPHGTELHTNLPLGAFGLSRHRFDLALANLAEEAGVALFTGEAVTDLRPQSGTVITSKRTLEGRLLIGSFGKRSTLDQRLQRRFLQRRSPYLGVKYHLRIPHEESRIELHNFADGYAGFSRVEDGLCCLCYLTTRANLKRHRTIPEMEKAVVWRNPHLARLFQEGEMDWEKPLVINEVSFAPKPLIEDGIVTCGDAAGMIAPLCGNGMAMALHGAHLLSQAVPPFLRGEVSRAEFERQYTRAWQRQFRLRLQAGRSIQALFGNPLITEATIRFFRVSPALTRGVVSLTHGREF